MFLSVHSDEISATRTGFQESNAAHQRTAERSQAFEEELHNTREVVDALRAESGALKAQVSVLRDEQVSHCHRGCAVMTRGTPCIRYFRGQRALTIALELIDLQVNEAAEDRKVLEGQLRHLQAGLTEGQEAARQEGRQEMERLEARLKDLLKDRSVVGVCSSGRSIWDSDPPAHHSEQGHLKRSSKMNWL